MIMDFIRTSPHVSRASFEIFEKVQKSLIASLPAVGGGVIKRAHDSFLEISFLLAAI